MEMAVLLLIGELVCKSHMRVQGLTASLELGALSSQLFWSVEPPLNVVMSEVFKGQ